MKKLFLIDGNSFCYRAYYAIKALSNSKGQPTNAIYGFTTMLNKIIKEQSPQYLAVAFDLKGPTFRHKKFKEYKIHRKPMPEDLVSQLPVIKRVLKAYNIPIFEREGYEADDVLATIVDKVKGKGIVTYIVTGDKDAMQLIGAWTKIYSPHKEDLVEEPEVKSRFGVSPERIPDVMALMGDASDNIPGIPGIGEKTAVELMKEFGTLEGIFKNIKKIKSEAIRKKILEFKEQAFLSRELALIDKKVPIKINIKDMELAPPDTEELIKLFKELEFKSLLKELVPREPLKAKYVILDRKKDFDGFLVKLKESESFVFDFETTHEDPMQARPVGISFSWQEKQAFYIPILKLADGLSADYVWNSLKEIFEDGEIRKIGQNIKYDFIVLHNLGITLKGIAFDTMVASYLNNPSKLNHNLGDLAMEFLNHKMLSIEELVGKGKKAVTMDMVEVEKAAMYGCEDSDVTLRIKNILEKKLEEKDLTELFYDIEIPLIEVLAFMEINGVSIDKNYLKSLSKEMDAGIENLKKNIYKLACCHFNINSTKQLQHVLFDKLKLPVIKRTKTGISTDEEVLRTLAAKHKLPKEILEYRELAKLKSTYADNLPGLINPETGRIHASFNQTVTQTGRLSSSEPNLQNIPIKTEMGRKIRKAFVPRDKGYYLVSADYSQIELRILAHLSGDKNLIDAFKEDRDIHNFTASLIFGVGEEDVPEEMRAQAKTVNFGIVYGMSPYGLSRDLGIDVDKAKLFIDAYFERYNDVRNYLEKSLNDARTKGYVTTLFQRRRYIPEINSENARLKGFAERTAINMPIQGSAADLIKIAMINIHRRLAGFDARMIIQVHDELVFEVLKKDLNPVAGIVREEMEHALDLKIPIKVRVEYGENWLDMEELALK